MVSFSGQLIPSDPPRKSGLCRILFSWGHCPFQVSEARGTQAMPRPHLLCPFSFQFYHRIQALCESSTAELHSYPNVCVWGASFFNNIFIKSWRISYDTFWTYTPLSSSSPTTLPFLPSSPPSPSSPPNLIFLLFSFFHSFPIQFMLPRLSWEWSLLPDVVRLQGVTSSLKQQIPFPAALKCE